MKQGGRCQAHYMAKIGNKGKFVKCQNIATAKDRNGKRCCSQHTPAPTPDLKTPNDRAHRRDGSAADGTSGAATC